MKGARGMTLLPLRGLFLFGCSHNKIRLAGN
jgi:hypothetical protein